MAFNAKAAAGAAVAIIVVLGLYLTMPLSPEEDSKDTTTVDATIQANRTDLRVGAELVLDGTHSTGDIVEYRWNLGEGSNRNGDTVTHSYNEVGRYHVSLTVTDGDGKTDKDYIYVRVFSVVWYNGTVNADDQEETHTFEVIWEERSEAPVQKAQGADILVTYDATPNVGDENQLNVTARSPAGDVERDSPDEEWEESGTKYARIIFVEQEMLYRGGDWEVTIRYDRGGLPPAGNSDIDYHVRIFVFY